MTVDAKICGDLDERGFAFVRDLGDGRMIGVMPLTFGRGCLGIGRSDAGAFDDVWDFLSLARAIAEAETWNPADEPEPQGWNRHPSTGRYRPGGNPAQEYRKP